MSWSAVRTLMDEPSASSTGGIFGADGHARPDDGLREIHRGDG